MRPGEVSALNVEDILREPTSVLNNIRRSKTDQEGAGVLQYLSPETMERVQRWIETASLTDGPIFRSVPRSNKPDRYNTPLSDRDVARIFKARALAAGLDRVHAPAAEGDGLHQGLWRRHAVVSRSMGRGMAVRRRRALRCRVSSKPDTAGRGTAFMTRRSDGDL